MTVSKSPHSTLEKCQWPVNGSFETVHWIVFISMSVIKGRCGIHYTGLRKAHMGTFRNFTFTNQCQFWNSSSITALASDAEAQLLMHCCWCTDVYALIMMTVSDALVLMQWWPYNDADILMLRHWCWCTCWCNDANALILMQWCWCTDIDAMMLMQWR